MVRKNIIPLLIFVFVCAGTAHALEPVTTEADGMSCMGYDKSRKQTETDALMNAKRNATESTMTSIKSETVIKDFKVEKDLVAAYANATVRVVETIESAWYRDDSAGDCYKVRILAEVTPAEAGPEGAGGKQGYRKAIEDKGIEYNGDSFVIAVRNGKKNVVELFIKAGIDLESIHSKDYRKTPPLLTASRKGDIEILRMLIEAGADVNATSGDGSSALADASLNGHAEAVKLLVEGGADLGKYGGSSLVWAVRKRHADIARYLLDKGVSARSGHGDKALIAASEGGDTEMARLLIDKGADVNARDSSKYTALIRAAEKGRAETAEMLIDKGANINDADKFGFTALIRASQYGKADAARLLIDKGADVNAMNKKDESALVWAVKNGKADVARVLVEAGADVDAKDKSGHSALEWARLKKKDEIIGILKKAE